MSRFTGPPGPHQHLVNSGSSGVVSNGSMKKGSRTSEPCGKRETPIVWGNLPWDDKEFGFNVEPPSLGQVHAPLDVIPNHLEALGDSGIGRSLSNSSCDSVYASLDTSPDWRSRLRGFGKPPFRDHGDSLIKLCQRPSSPKYLLNSEYSRSGSVPFQGHMPLDGISRTSSGVSRQLFSKTVSELRDVHRLLKCLPRQVESIRAPATLPIKAPKI